MWTGENCSDRRLLFGCGKNGKTLKNMLVSLVDILCFCFALPCSVVLKKCVNLFITCLSKKITKFKQTCPFLCTQFYYLSLSLSYRCMHAHTFVFFFVVF